MPQLDGVRGVAIAAVLLAHYTPVTRYGEFGVMGVQLFFVLSGFLITGILLRGRDGADRLGGSKPFALRQFYGRRFLRIFPAYYATLCVCVVFGIGTARTAFLWHASYTTNFYCAIINPNEAVLNHFWSLAVEEQFYLLWPWAVIFAPRRCLPYLLVALIMTAPAYRFMAGLLHWNSPAKNWLLIGCTDSLALGGLLAWSRHTGAWERGLRLVTRAGLIVGLPVWLATILVWAVPEVRQRFPLTYSHLTFALLFTWIVNRAADGRRDPFGVTLSFPPLAYLGKISYGVYLVHQPVQHALPKAFAWCGIPYPGSAIGVFAVLMAFTLALTSLSWHFMEAPINNLKRHFPYAARPPARDASAVNKQTA